MTSTDDEDTGFKKLKILRGRGNGIFIFSIILWTVLLLSMSYLLLSEGHRHMQESARIQARAAFDIDVLYRSWNAESGGVYVAQSESITPNEYLTNVHERDVVTNSGRKLTLMDPSYMTRMVHEKGKKELGIIAHLTSLNPIRPENFADEWETKALKELENGVDEVSSIEIIADEPYMNLMKPLITEQNCLQCHSAQGYKLGDIRGGIRISVPLKNFNKILSSYKRGTVVLTLVLWILGIVGMIYWKLKVLKSEEKRLKVIRDLNISNTTKDRFFSLIAHDLKSPFNTLLGMSEILSENVDDLSSNEIREMTKSLNSVSKDSFELLENLLNWSRSQMKKMKVNKVEVYLSEIVEKSMRILKHMSVKKELVIVNEVDSNICVLGDQSMIQTIIRNLVSNAIKFSNAGGMIGISASLEGDNIVVAIRDNGVGMSESKIKTVFQLESRTTESGTAGEKGTGLGLLISKEFTQMNGGKMWVESKIGEGTTFFFSLKGKVEE